MPIDIDKLRGLLAKATKGPWEVDSEYDPDGAYGSGPDHDTGYHNYFVGAEVDGKWRTLMDTVNSDHKLIEDDRDEDGGRSWDAIGHGNANLVAAAITALPALLDELERKTKALEASETLARSAIIILSAIELHCINEAGLTGIDHADEGKRIRRGLQGFIGTDEAQAALKGEPS